MPKLLCNFIEITLRHGHVPVNLLHIFRTPFGGLLLYNVLYNKNKQSYSTQSNIYDCVFFEKIVDS